MELIQTPTCRWCGKGPLSPCLSFRPEDYQDLTFNLISCKNCGTWQVNPHPSPQEVKDYFTHPDRWKIGHDPEGRTINPIARSESRLNEYRLYAETMRAFLPRHGVIMDVGSGTGLMLSLLPESLTKLAVEPHPEAASAAIKRHLTVITDWAENLSPPKQPLTALILNQSLDHLIHPDHFLERALTWLAPGGLILISSLINPHSLTARIFTQNFRLWHPFHQVYPPPGAVYNLLAQQGFEILSTWKPYFNTSHGSPIRLVKDAGQLLLAALNLNSDPSPPWPGNVVSYLARKKVLFQPLKATSQATNSLNVPC